MLVLVSTRLACLSLTHRKQVRNVPLCLRLTSSAPQELGSVCEGVCGEEAHGAREGIKEGNKGDRSERENGNEAASVRET